MKEILGVLMVSVSIVAVSAIAFGQTSSPVIVRNEVLLAKESGTYMEVRHIVLRGSNEEIGKALGDIAQEWLGVKLGRYAAPVYAKARRLYMEKNYPILLERMKGIARSYGISSMDNTYVTSGLYYDMAPFACSSVYFPASSTTNGHALFSHNMDFYITTMREMMGMDPVEGEHDMFSRNFVMELYPDKGYPSIVVGALDLLNGAQSGMNSEGLIVAMLADHDAPASDKISPLGDDSGGLNILQLVRLLLDTCASVEEAKCVLLNNKLTVGFEPAHLQVCDRFDNSFIFETSSKDFSSYFTDNRGRPQIMTNHAVYLYPDVNEFPEYSPKATYNTFYRYRTLYDYLQEHQGKFSDDDAKEALSRVYAHTHDVDEGAALPTPCRTLWPVVYDINERTLELKFYLKDGEVDPITGDPTLMFSQPFKFRLKVDR